MPARLIRFDPAPDLVAQVYARLLDAIYGASGNDLIAQSAHAHWRHLRRVIGAVFQQSGQREALRDEHEAIADAMALGDSKRAATLISGYAERASGNLTDILNHVLAERQGDTR